MSRVFQVTKKAVSPKLVYFDSPIVQISSGQSFTIYLTEKNSLYISKHSELPEILDVSPKKSLCEHCKKLASKKCIICENTVCKRRNCVANHAKHELVPIPRTDPRISRIGSGNFHSFFVLDKNKVYGMGENLSFQLGNGEKSPNEFPSFVFEFEEGQSVKFVACGRNHSVFIVNFESKFEDFDRVYVCGSGRKGQLGTGKLYDDLKEGYEKKIAMNSSKILKNKRVTHADCGENFTLLLTVDEKKTQRLLAFGESSEGQLGLGIKMVENVYTPKEVKFTDEKIMNIACGNYHSMVLTEANIYTTGLNLGFQLGLNHNKTLFVFAKIPILDFSGQYALPSGIACGVFYSIFAIVEKKSQETKIYMVGRGFKGIGECKYIETKKRIFRFSCQEESYCFICSE